MEVRIIELELFKEILKERSIKNVSVEYPLITLQETFNRIVQGDKSQIPQVNRILDAIVEYPVIDIEEGLSDEQLFDVVFQRLHRAKELYLNYSEDFDEQQINYLIQDFVMGRIERLCQDGEIKPRGVVKGEIEFSMLRDGSYRFEINNNVILDRTDSKVRQATVSLLMQLLYNKDIFDSRISITTLANCLEPITGFSRKNLRNSLRRKGYSVPPSQRECHLVYRLLKDFMEQVRQEFNLPKD